MVNQEKDLKKKNILFNAWKTRGELANGFEITREILNLKRNHAREFSFLLVLNLFVFPPKTDSCTLN